MTSTAPNEDVKEKISCKLVSEIIRERIKSDGTRFHANDNISKYILPGKNCFNFPFLSIDNTTEVSHSKDLFCTNSAYDFVKKNTIKILKKNNLNK